jgi:ABC-2 type transport system ATP-binding protein
VSIAKALLNKPELLLLDEPTASLDPDAGDKVRTQLTRYQRESGATLLLASHNMPEVERMCDAVYMMRAGAIVDSGSPSELLTRYGRGTMEEVFLDVAQGGGAVSAARRGARFARAGSPGRMAAWCCATSICGADPGCACSKPPTGRR